MNLTIILEHIDDLNNPADYEVSFTDNIERAKSLVQFCPAGSSCLMRVAVVADGRLACNSTLELPMSVESCEGPLSDEVKGDILQKLGL